MNVSHDTARLSGAVDVSPGGATTIEPLQLIRDLKSKIHASLDEFVPSGAPLALVDFPDIRNVGDSAIWLGQMAYLRSRRINWPQYVSRMWDFSDVELEACVPEGPIFIHGGGNFGDLWEAHQAFRERILARWPGRQVIQFPASIHYDSPARADESARIIDRHGNFILMVRDEESRHFAQQRFNCRVILCPDMALCIGAIKSRPHPPLPVLAMLRNDKEKAGSHDLSAFPDVPVEDWVSEPWLPVRAAKALGMAGAMLTFDPMRVRFGRLDAAARQRFRRGIRQIGRARAIVTDRLHVHVLALLLGRPHAVLDNSYGKIAHLMAAFSGGTNLSYRAKSLPDAIEWARAHS
ncbi:MAG TPA: polysaccharide pyruvyl transferase family protein [Povalibacter sp.]